MPNQTRKMPLVAFALCLAATAGASAQGSPSTPPPGGHATVGEALEPGANSFTEAQVRARFAEMGFTDVKDLKKDEKGLWHARATHAGKELDIGLDYKGHVAAQ